MKTLWIEQCEQMDIFGGKTLILTANICPRDGIHESELRRQAKDEMREIAKAYVGG